MKSLHLTTSLILLSTLSLLPTNLGCSSSAADDDPPEDSWSHPPLDDSELHFGNAPDPDDLVADGKADEVYPTSFVLPTTAVRNQGSRGTCSFFAVSALLEQILLQNGSNSPDVSEEYLHWLVKRKLGLFADSEGANCETNLNEAIRYGFMDETAWPYDPTGDSSPLPANLESIPLRSIRSTHFVRPDPQSIKHWLHTKKTSVVLSLPTHCQAWNLPQCALPVQQSLWNAGTLTQPNPEDVQNHTATRGSSHAVLIVGWNDQLEVQRRDAAGNPMVADGQPVKDKGFYLVKNSWGTNSLGNKSTSGKPKGYIWVSMDYVRKFGTIVTTSLDAPELPPFQETCIGGFDEDGNGSADCSDQACSDSSTCTTEGETQSFQGPSVTPQDGTETVVSSDPLEVPAIDNNVTVLGAALDIDHPQPADLDIWLERNGTRVELINREQGQLTHLSPRQMFLVPQSGAFASPSGTWKLHVRDRYKEHKGSVSWTLLTHVCNDCGTNGKSNNVTSVDQAITESEDLVSRVQVAATGFTARAIVTANIDHPRPSDLELELHKLTRSGDYEYSEERFDLQSRIHPSFSMTQARYIVPVGMVSDEPWEDPRGIAASGDWELHVRDVATGETGTLKDWSLHLERCNETNCTIDHRGAAFETPTAVSGQTQEFPLTVEGDSSPALGGSVYFALQGGQHSQFDVSLHKLGSNGTVEMSYELSKADPSAPETSQATSYNTILIPELMDTPVSGNWVVRLTDRVGAPNGTIRYVSLTFQVAGAPSNNGNNTDTGSLYFSEYSEGGLGRGMQKVVEIANGGAAQDLSQCEVRVYQNGSSAFRAIALKTTIDSNETYVLCNSSMTSVRACSQLSNDLGFNGDDAVELVCDGQVLDRIGQVGFDPGSAWQSGAVSTKDKTLRRNCSVTRGDTGTGAFDVAAEWTAFPDSDLSDLGYRRCE